MKRFSRIISVIGIAGLIFSSTYCNTYAISNKIYEKTREEVISTGVTHRHILRFNKDGWLNANVTYIDLKNEGIELDLLQSSKGIKNKETLSTMVKDKENVVTAINGDFFLYTNPDSPLGAMVKDGKMINSPVFVRDFATLSVDKDNIASADYWEFDIIVSNQDGNNLSVSTINKYTHEYQLPMIIDRNWGDSTPGYNENHYDMVEIIVVEDEVVEVRRKEGPTSIPENGYVILASQKYAQDLYDNFKVGDILTVDIKIKPKSLEDIKLALGGGTLLVKEGQIANFTQDLSGNAPRTAVGITKDRKQLILVAIDGRHNFFKGVDGQGLAKFMIELGSHEAIVMDGGGSTTMLVRELGEFQTKLVNYPSDGSERRIINGLAVLSNKSQGEIKGIKASFDNERSFVGIPRDIDVKAYDINNNPLKVDTNQLRFSLLKGEGDFIGQRFIPRTSGKTIVQVDYLGAKTEIELDVLEEVALLKVSPSSFRLGYNQSITPKITAFDKKGYSVTIDPKDIKWEDTNNLGTFVDGKYTSGTTQGHTTIVASLNNKSVNIPVVIGSEKVTLGGLYKYPFKFNSYPSTVNGSISLDTNAKISENSLRLQYDFTNSGDTRAAYIEFDKGSIPLSSTTSKIGIWVYADEDSFGWIRGNIKDGNGTRHTIDFSKSIDWTGWKYIEASIPENIVKPMELERIYVVETNSDIRQKGQLLFDGIDVSQSPKLDGVVIEPTLNDYLNIPYNTKGTQILVHSGITLGSTPNDTKDVITKKVQNLINKDNSLSVFTSTLDAYITQGIEKDYTAAVPGYSSKTYENNLILNLDNRSGGLRTTNYKQWPWLIDHLENTHKDNIFVILPRPIWGTNGFTDKMEADLFIDKLTETANKGKKVFVLYGGGNDVNVELKDGVRYISTGRYNPNSPTDLKYIEFNILKDNVTYQIKPMFN